jgi:hypothetical protein
MYFWALFLFPTGRDLLTIVSPEKVNEGCSIIPEQTIFPWPAKKIETVDKDDICQLGRLLLLSLTGFLVTGWFLSRAFVVTFFLLGGFVEVVFEMALLRGMISPRLPTARVLRYSGGLAISLVLVMYIMIRILHLV